MVITHGTDTMEELAFLLDLVHADPRPVVFTGAQRPFDHPAPDGPANLADALAVASSPLARNRGVLLSFDGYVYLARGVTKADTLGAHAFDAPGRGPALRVAGGAVSALTPAARPPTLPFDHGTAELPEVDVVPLYTGGGGADLAAAGAVFGADLSPWQGRMLLTVALTLPDPLAALRAWLKADTTEEAGA